MLKQFRILILAFTIVSSSIVAPNTLWAQGQNSASGEELQGTRKQMATIIFAGLAGAVLGLSTLSFYGRPQDKLSNIAVGFAVGVVAGTVYTTYKAIHAPYEQYNVYERFEKQDQMLRTNFGDQLTERFAQESANEFKRPLGWQWTF